MKPKNYFKKAERCLRQCHNRIDKLEKYMNREIAHISQLRTQALIWLQEGEEALEKEK